MKISLLVCVLMRRFNDVKVVEFVTYCIMSASDSTVRGSKRSASSPARSWRHDMAPARAIRDARFFLDIIKLLTVPPRQVITLPFDYS